MQGARIRESGTTEGSEPDSTENPIPGAAVRGDGGTWRQGCSRPQRVALDRCPAWSQVGSTILAQAAGVPTYPWSGTGVQISYEECNGVIPEEIYERACLQSENAAHRCRAIGYPVMLKASWGGGGKGIRTVRSDDEVEAALRQVRTKMRLFGMRREMLCVIGRRRSARFARLRHEAGIQMSTSGGSVALRPPRECLLSLLPRLQPPASSPEDHRGGTRPRRRIGHPRRDGKVHPHCAAALWRNSTSGCRSARALAKSVGYVGAATVEYLYSVEEGRYYFLELNPRLQVEHPVTEGITGVNLPACQVMVAMGIPLHRIPDIRHLYCEDPHGDSPIDFESHERRDPEGYVVAVRLTSENANDGFKPTSGDVDELHFRPTSDVWGYFSVKSGGGVHEFSDSQFGHLFAKGPTRQEAIRSMLMALKEVKIRGEIRTTVDYIIDMIQEPDFVLQRVHTAWLDNRIAQQVTDLQRVPL